MTARVAKRLSVWVALGLFVAFGLWLTGPRAVLCFAAGAFLYILPGWLACRLLWGGAFARRAESLGHTLILGLLLTTGVTAAIAGMGLKLSKGLFLSTLSFLVLILGFLVWRRRERPPPFSIDPGTFDGTGRIVLSAALIVTLLVIAIPLSNVGRRVDGTYVYVSFFNVDFFRSIALAAQISKEVVPVENPYFIGETLHYYWFYQVFPAFVYQLTGGAVSLQSLLLLEALLADVAFLCVFVWLARRFIRRSLSMAVVLCLALLAESYQAPFKAIVIQRGMGDVAADPLLGSIALPPVGYYFQTLLYVSQHLVALTALLLIIPLLNEDRRTGMSGRAAIAGGVLGLASGFSFFIGFFGLAWATLWLMFVAFRWWRRGMRVSRAVLPSALVLGAAAVSYLGYERLGMLVAEGGFVLLLKPDLRQLLSPLHYLVMLGPSLVLGLVGCALWARNKRRPPVTGILGLLVLAFIFVQFVFLPRAWYEVSQKLGLVLRVPLLLYAGIGMDIVSTLPATASRRRWGIAALLLCLSGLPNLLAYEWVHFDVADSSLATYVRETDRRGAEWVRDHTPAMAVVQSLPGQLSAYPYSSGAGHTYSLLAVFGERQMAVGDFLFAQVFGIPTPSVKARRAEVSQLFKEPQLPNVLDAIQRYGIDYVFWGTDEMACCGDSIAWYEDSSLFEKVYEREGVSVFQVQQDAVVHYRKVSENPASQEIRGR